MDQRLETKVSRNILIVFLVSIIINSCNAQELNKSEEKLVQCVNESLNKNIKAYEGKNNLNFYDFILKVESRFIDIGILKDISNSDYEALLLKIINSTNTDELLKKAFSIQSDLIKEYGFTPFSTEIIFSQCPYNSSVDSKDGDGKAIYNQGIALNNLMKYGFQNEQLIYKLMESVDEDHYEKVIYRAPCLIVAMINLDNKYNPDTIEFNKNKKSKKIGIKN